METGDQKQTFEDVVRPLMAWLAKNKNPHTTVIVTSTLTEMFEGVKCVYPAENQPTSPVDGTIEAAGEVAEL